VFLLVYLAGLEMPLDEIGRSLRGGGSAVGALGFALPFLALYGLCTLFGLGLEASLFAGLVFGLTALPVSVRVLMDLGLSDHPIGRTIVACAVLTEVCALTGLGILLSIRGAASFEAALATAAVTLIKTALLVSIVVTFVQAFRLTTGTVPSAQRFFRGAVAVLRGREALFGVATLFVLAFAGASQLLGLHFVVGAFFGGLLLSPQILGEWNFKQIQRTTSAATFGLLAPIFFGLIGLRFAPDALLLRPDLVVALAAAGFAAKYAAGALAARAIGQDRLSARAVGIGLTMHGVLELVIANLALELGVFDASLFSTVVLVSLASTIIVPPLLRRQASRLREASPEAVKGRPSGAGEPPPRAPPAPVRPKIVLLGGGRVAVEVARALGRCTIVEKSEDQARYLRLVLTEAVVQVGDAARPADLARAGVGPGTTVLAVTDDPAANEAAVREAVRLRASRVIARAERAAEADRLRSAGADEVVNVAEEAATALVQEIYPLGESMAEVHLAKGSPAVAKPVGGLALPLGVSLRSVTRRGRVLVPTRDLLLQGRDAIVLSGPPASIEAARRALLGNRHGRQALCAYCFVSLDQAAAELVAAEVAPLALGSGGALAAIVPVAPDVDAGAAAATGALLRYAPGAQVLDGFGLSAADLDSALAQDEVIRLAEAPRGDEAEPAEDEGLLGLVAVPVSLVGRGRGRITPRRAAALPVVLGLPLYVAARGRPPEHVTAIIDGTESAEAVGSLACDAALTLGARLSLVVVGFEGDREPHEQADFVQNYARVAGLGHVEVTEFSEPAPHAVARAAAANAGLIVAPAAGRALNGRALLEAAAEGGASVLLV
jgi:Kef-type K+ transport system membrane component KefB/Trk K+ transport system NAD-binding subunit